MFDFSLSNILHSNIFNFVIMVLLLYKLTVPFIKKTIASANEKTTKIVNKSVENKEKALKELQETKEDYAKTPAEKEEISEIAKRTIDSLKKKSEEDTENAKKIIEDNLSKSVRTESSKIKANMTKEMAELSVNHALEKITEQLSWDRDLHDRLIEQTIDELEIV